MVPAGQMYIEALRDLHRFLEEFKLRDRAVDMNKVGAEVCEAEVENLRRAAKLVHGERENPEIDKRVFVEREPAVTIDSD